jgi:gluconokinase
MIVVLMGVMGTGKTTIGHLLVEKTGWEFAEGDDFHSKANVEKMHAGIPLNDEDRLPRLKSLHGQISDWQRRGVNAVLTCSALKQAYRDILRGDLPANTVKFVLLQAQKAVLEERVSHRPGHFMSPALLESQLATLEDPKDALHISVEKTPEDAVGQILADLGQISAK